MSKRFSNSKVMFRIRLKDAHDRSGLTAYKVWKETGISQATVRKYAEADEVISDVLPNPVITLAEFYGVDWRDPAIVQVIAEVDDESGQNETPLGEALRATA